MGQMGFFDLGNRYSGLDAKNEPLLKIDGVVPWEDLRARLEAVWRRADKVRKSRAGRKPWDAIVMFKTIILCALYNLSDDQVEHQIRDRLSFMRFLGLGLEGRVPDAKTVWLYREQLTQAGVIEALFETFDGSSTLTCNSANSDRSFGSTKRVQVFSDGPNSSSYERTTSTRSFCTSAPFSSVTLATVTRSGNILSFGRWPFDKSTSP